MMCYANTTCAVTSAFFSKVRQLLRKLENLFQNFPVVQLENFDFAYFSFSQNENLEILKA